MAHYHNVALQFCQQGWANCHTVASNCATGDFEKVGIIPVLPTFLMWESRTTGAKLHLGGSGGMPPQENSVFSKAKSCVFMQN